MTTTVLINSETTQVVLTPETDWERSALASITDKNTFVSIKKGSFKESVGGYYRDYADEQSVFIRISPMKSEKTPSQVLETVESDGVPE